MSSYGRMDPFPEKQDVSVQVDATLHNGSEPNVSEPLYCYNALFIIIVHLWREASKYLGDRCAVRIVKVAPTFGCQLNSILLSVNVESLACDYVSVDHTRN